MQIVQFNEIVSPEVGAKICGCDAGHVSISKHGDLYAIGLEIDDGRHRLLIVAMDILGLGAETVCDQHVKCTKM